MSDGTRDQTPRDEPASGPHGARVRGEAGDEAQGRGTPEASAPMGRRERRKLEVRGRIYAAAQQLFAKQGFDATTVDEIANLADVAPTTFFNHFHSKQALLGLMAREVVDELQNLTTRHLEGEDSSFDRLRRFVASAAEAIGASRGVARDVLLEFMRSDATPDGPHPYLQRIHEPFVELIEQGQRRGEIRDDHDAGFLAQMAVGMLNSAITSWLTDPDYPVETGLVEATEFVLGVLAPPPARSSMSRRPRSSAAPSGPRPLGAS